MIYESIYGKEALTRSAQLVRSLSQKRGPSERDLYKIEREIMINFYAIRKLLDGDGKITDSVRNHHTKLKYYPNVVPVNPINKNKIETVYDLSKEHIETRDLYFLCGRIIHSYTFLLSGNENGQFDGILFCSDHDKNVKLYRLDLQSLLDLFELVGADYPTKVCWERNRDGAFKWNAE